MQKGGSHTHTPGEEADDFREDFGCIQQICVKLIFTVLSVGLPDAVGRATSGPVRRQGERRAHERSQHTQMHLSN